MELLHTRHALPTTELFKSFVQNVNGIPPEKLPRILTRICARLPEKGTQFFSADEEAQLNEYLALPPASTRVLIQALALVYDQAATLGWKAAAVLTALGNAGVQEATATVIAQAWATESSALLSVLRGQILGAPAVLVDSDMTISLGIGSQAHTRDAATRALLSLTMAEEVPSAAARGITPAIAAAAGGKPGDEVTAALAAEVRQHTHDFDIAFDRESLSAFLEKLDRVQQQIDSLSA